MTKLARYVMDNLPQPNRPTAALSVANLGIASNFGNFDRNSLDDDKGAAKLDHQFRPSVQSFFRYAQRRQNIAAPALIPGPAGGNNHKPNEMLRS